MAETFSYTNSSSVTKTLTFGTGNPGHLVGDNDNIDLMQDVEFTYAGDMMVSKRAVHKFIYEYTMLLPKADTITDFADFLEFISSTYINGGVNAFTWTDYNTDPFTVKLISIASIKNEPTANGLYKRITVLLRET